MTASAPKEAVVKIIGELTGKEQDLLSKVLMLEYERLYQKNPSLKTEILRIVREVIK